MKTKIHVYGPQKAMFSISNSHKRSLKNIWKSNPSWHQSNKFLGSFVSTLDKSFFHIILYILKMLWLCKIYYTQNIKSVKSLPLFDFYILVNKMLCFTVFLWLWLNALKKYLAKANINLTRILNLSSLLLLFYSVLTYCSTYNLKIYFFTC